MATTDASIDTSDLIQVERPMASFRVPALSLDSQVTKSPFYIGQVPTTAIVNPDSVRNFHMPGIPQYRIVPPQPLNLAGAGANATPSAAIQTPVVPRPPAPAISQALTTTPVGYQFTFLQVNLPTSLIPAATIDSYKVYRSTTNNTGTAQVYRVITHNPANAGGPVVVQDVQPFGTVMYYWVSAVNVGGKESTLTSAQSGAVNTGSLLNAQGQAANSTILNVQSSLVASGALSAFSYTSNASSITVIWTNFPVYRPDQTSMSVTGNSIAFNSLSASTTYHFGIYVDLNAVVHVVLSDTSAGTALGSIGWQVQTINADGHAVVTPDWTASTTSGVAGGGSGTGHVCFSGNTRLAGGLQFDQIEVAAAVHTLYGLRLADLLIHDYEGEMIDMGRGELVTATHRFYHRGLWLPAAEYFADRHRVEFSGKVYNLHVRTEHDCERHYILANGGVAHNYKID